jgi:hypothetical protein
VSAFEHLLLPPEVLKSIRHQLGIAHGAQAAALALLRDPVGLPAGLPHLVSAALCERVANGRLDANKCVNTNVYVFNWRAKPHELLSIGLVGLTRSEKQDWESFESSQLH